jgi:hypothetical protein
MARRQRRPRKSEGAQIAFRDEVVQENLPLPVVHYPSHYGTFFAFAESESEMPLLCSCAEPAVANWIRLQETGTATVYVDQLKMAPLSSRFFPVRVARASLLHDGDPLGVVRFRERLCHRCNLVTPTLRYCHEMYGQRFVQHHGWYINQAYVRLGILPLSFSYLADVCPPAYQNSIREFTAADAEYQEQLRRIMRVVQGPEREDMSVDEVTYWHNVRLEEASEMTRLRRRAARLRSKLTNGIENIVRVEFGFRKVGEAWVSETLLYQLFRNLLPGEEILRHHRPDWLNGLELDLYIPRLRLGVEYQGQQHFHAIRAWGGEEALQAVRERDALKARTCRKAGVRLVTFDYTEALTEEHVMRRVAIVLPTTAPSNG